MSWSQWWRVAVTRVVVTLPGIEMDRLMDLRQVIQRTEIVGDAGDKDLECVEEADGCL